MERDRNIQGPLHIVRCIGELTVMYVQHEILRPLSEAFDDALDVWPED